MDGMLNYFIPEDGDTPEHCNVFPLPQVNPDTLTLGDIEKVLLGVDECLRASLITSNVAFSVAWQISFSIQAFL